ncbi:hypothetical protein Tco_0706164 [Tanacetum coccineum]|uniref:Uncharacterized protein n=1 Tax=Tanacetum coccineum TaxID=301880 RepID=A0ABQ4Y8Q5_9ASTR
MPIRNFCLSSHAFWAMQCFRARIQKMYDGYLPDMIDENDGTTKVEVIAKTTLIDFCQSVRSFLGHARVLFTAIHSGLLENCPSMTHIAEKRLRLSFLKCKTPLRLDSIAPSNLILNSRTKKELGKSPPPINLSQIENPHSKQYSRIKKSMSFLLKLLVRLLFKIKVIRRCVSGQEALAFSMLVTDAMTLSPCDICQRQGKITQRVEMPLKLHPMFAKSLTSEA